MECQVLEDQLATTLQRRHGQTNEQHEPGNHAVDDAGRFARIPRLILLCADTTLEALATFPMMRSFGSMRR